jgi:uncharacterized iron-regulated membrane protein
MGRDVNGKLRKIIFWLHLIAGVVAGVIIFVMSATGVALAFDKEIQAWAERDARRITQPTADAKPLGLDVLLAKLREQRPGERPSTITLEADPTVAVAVSFGRTNTFYLDPYSGAIREPGAKKTRAFLQTMIAWHRFLGAGEERRVVGKAITGACNVAFLFLAMSGLYLWWPRQWTKNILSTVGLMNFKLRGKARDFNWHNAIGLWCAPVLIVLTATAMPISYRWAGDLIYKMTGTTPPPQGTGPGGTSSAAVEIPPPPPGSKPLGLEAMFAVAQKEFPHWQQIVYRTGGAGGGGGRQSERGANASIASTNAPAVETTNAPAANRERGERRSEGQRERGASQPVTLAIKMQNQWPLFSTTQITLDPFTGNVLQREGFSDQNLGRQVRSWTRYLHTGEALGMVGKAVAGLASAGALVLVWTGFALTWRRFFSRASKVA